MIPRPNNRVVHSADVHQRKPAVVGVSVQRPPATIRDALGRDPKQEVITGHTGLINQQQSNNTRR